MHAEARANARFTKPITEWTEEDWALLSPEEIEKIKEALMKPSSNSAAECSILPQETPHIRS